MEAILPLVTFQDSATPGTDYTCGLRVGKLHGNLSAEDKSSSSLYVKWKLLHSGATARLKLEKPSSRNTTASSRMPQHNCNARHQAAIARLRINELDEATDAQQLVLLVLIGAVLLAIATLPAIYWLWGIDVRPVLRPDPDSDSDMAPIRHNRFNNNTRLETQFEKIKRTECVFFHTRNR